MVRKINEQKTTKALQNSPTQGTRWSSLSLADKSNSPTHLLFALLMKHQHLGLLRLLTTRRLVNA